MGSPWKVIFAFLGVFAAGAVFGGFLTARTASKKIQEQQQPVAVAPTAPVPAPTPAVNRPANQLGNLNRGASATITPFMLKQLSVQLKLTDEQKEKITPIIKRADEDMTYLRRENFRSTARVLERMHAEIAVMLTPEQKTELEVQKRLIQERMQRAEADRRADQLLRKEQKARSNAQDAALKGN